ncbi:hypothetical protein B0H34DRAFT_683719 [Crassisporium funariophilum]|nr:hypothetical protein B0H34DRAFT_683719 [Crassisporium funariophilum]
MNDQLFPRKSHEIPPPSYQQSSKSPLILAETTTTRTEVVTTTTTETTTHLFSLPYWRRRAGPQSPNPHQLGPVSDTSKYTSRPPHIPSNDLLFDKALPPTPPDELVTTGDASNSESLQSRITTPPALQSTAALAHAALGLGLPHASMSIAHAEANTIAFVSPVSPLSPVPSAPPTVRRAKSSLRIQPRHASEDLMASPDGDSILERRRGLSFGATSLLKNGVPDVKGKAKQREQEQIRPSTSPKLLTRRTSFWLKKKPVQASETIPSRPHHDDSVLTLPPLPLVHHVSPFNITHLTEGLPTPPTSQTAHARGLSRSQSESNGLGRSPVPSSDETSISASSSQPIRPPQITASSDYLLAQPHGLVNLPRPRAHTNPPILHRLSLGVFSSLDSPSSPVLRSSDSNQFSAIATQPLHVVPRQPDTPIPKPSGESPEIYLVRLKSAVTKAEVAGILASSADPFYVQALRAYINQFDFLSIPLDVALRKLLMEVGLPRETQQIDRVIEAFAFRYMQCNPSLFVSEDHPYILAFSLIMLHTDAFNRSNKRKMTKQDYIKNTRLPGVPTEVLNCFFDNIVFAPFIFIEDPIDVNGQPGLIPDVAWSMSLSTPTSAMSTSTNATFKIGNKVDPYYLIVNNLLGPLRVDVETYIPLENPFTFEGTDGPWDEQDLHQAFVEANIIEINVPAMNRTSSIFTSSPSSAPGSPIGDVNASDAGQLGSETWSLKITKVGQLNRKDDMLEGGKKSSNRKWKPWSVILTGSQLLFFRDLAWSSALLAPCHTPEQSISPSTAVFRPDELFSVKDSVAVYDRSYTKYPHTLRFVLPDGRHLLLQASGEKDLNEWISRINYASAFRSAGVKMRPLELTGEDVHLTGVAAATSHLHDMQQQFHVPHRSWGSDAPHHLMGMLSNQQSDRPSLKRRLTISGQTEFDLDAPVAPEVDGAEQFKATFDKVKADLAAASSHSSDDEHWLQEEKSSAVCDSPPTSPTSVSSSSSRLPSRSHIIRSKIHELDSKIAASRSQLEADVRCLRNIATLTPFQKSTRSRLVIAVQGMAKRVMQVRLDMEKLMCHRVVLRCDLTTESRSWDNSKRVALRAAKETLQSRRAHMIPKMTLSLHNDHLHPVPIFTGDPTGLCDTPSPGRPDSSTSCGSFHSAPEFALDWASSEDPALLRSSRTHDSPQPTSSISASFVTKGAPAAPDSPERIRCRSLSSSSNSNHPSGQLAMSTDSHPPVHDVDSQDEHGEQAEDWNRTRCGHRVSLVHVPSDIRISTRLTKITSKD